jgi:hypothetical protein
LTQASAKHVTVAATSDLKVCVMANSSENFTARLMSCAQRDRALNHSPKRGKTHANPIDGPRECLRHFITRMGCRVTRLREQRHF